MPTQNSIATKIPKDGWVHELGDAESAAKRSPSAGAHLRLAIAAYKLRDFKKLKAAVNRGLALDPSEGEKELLKEYVEKCKEQKEMILPRDLIKKMYEPSTDCDTFRFVSDICPFTNLYILQHAVLTGDVALMEEVVALGAALDFSIGDKSASDIPPLPAPPGSTALLLACATLAVNGEMERRYPNFLRDSLGEEAVDEVYECAIRLVYLGANCQVKLQIPAQRRNTPVNPKDPVTAYRILNFSGKTAQELACISGRRELIRAIELMQKPENVHLTQCRCGSRLPWNQCHGAPVPGQSDLYIEGDNGCLQWRYSPKGRCPCNLTNEVHYKCCWFTANPSYKNDTSGAHSKMVNAESGRPTTQTLRRLQYLRLSEIAIPTNHIIPQGTTSEEYRNTQTDLIRSEGLTVLDDFNGRRCGVKDWDPMVYAGVVDRIDDCFTWNDLHWQLAKVELLQRTKEWNEGLEKYCDDMGLTEAEREAVVPKHTANPCAPCSNPSCNNWETKPKEFQKCSRCKSVAYCSSDCQKKDWKAQHKSTCIENCNKIR
jgi:hypothetical protein